ncbi:ABC transporter permease [Pseudalkalibacillus sp. A8]|uniref:ABC transporter permease n=1 Tax=Pseudalkalibacillus sp. A8 TaxID=3382641 RepID=UPI0038B62F90
MMQQSKWLTFLKWIPIFLIFGFIVLPVFMVVWISFFSTSLITFPPKGYSFKWFVELLHHQEFMSSFLLSLKVSFFAMIISLVLGLLGSIALIRYDFKGRKILELLFLSPLIVPTIITGIGIYIFLFNAERLIGIDMVPNLWALVTAHVIICIPWTVRLISAGLLSINPSLEEAAIDLGSTRTQAFVKIVLPNLRPSIIAAAILSFIHSFNNLEISLMLVRPGELTLPIEILNYVFWKVDPLIAAVSTVQIILIGILMWIANKFISIGKVF